MGFSNKNLLAHVLVAHFLIIMLLGATPPSLARAIINDDASGDDAQDLSKMFEEWMTKYLKVYSDEATKAQRFGIFKQNWEYIQNFNKQGKESYTVGLNGLSDLTTEEFMAIYGRNEDVIPNPPTAQSTSSSSSSPDDFTIDYIDYETCYENIDWTKHGYIGGVQWQSPNGRPCGSCWAFAAAAAVEGIAQIRNFTFRMYPHQLSVQQIVDCDKNNHGCAGGLTVAAYDYIIKNGGLASAADYPYTGNTTTESKCQTITEKFTVAGITGYTLVPPNNESELIKALCVQPVAARITATKEFHQYKGGVFSSECGTSLGHAVTIVGMGTTEDGVKFWKLMNSWGTWWGEDGYMRILRGTGKPEGHCGINMGASYPTIDIPEEPPI